MARREAFHDEASWRLPDWEALSEGCARDSDAESDASSAAPLRVPRSPPMASTTSVTATRLLPMQVADLRALHLRFAKERQEAAASEQTTAIATQLESVREQLREFQQQWQATTEAAVPPRATSPSADRAALRFDMAVQTDVTFNDDALRQWLHLITQKMEVLTTSFHGDTTQLPLKYPLQSQLDRPVSFPSKLAGAETESIASWHVGGSLKTLVSESTAERLLDLERAVACLATATRETTTRYVEYFEKIVMQIQDLHQQRLRQVVDESLEEMKTQRARYKRRVEVLEAECRAAKDGMSTHTHNRTTSKPTNRTEEIDVIVREREEDWRKERQFLIEQSKQLERELIRLKEASHEYRAREEDLRCQLEQMVQEREAAERQAQEALSEVDKLRKVDSQQREQIGQLEETRSHLQAELLQTQQVHQTKLDDVVATHSRVLQETLDTANARRKQDLEQQRQRFRREIDELERKWCSRIAEAEENKAQVPVTTQVDQGIQTEGELFEEVTTDERIARLKKRCKALENLLEKKFEDSSAASCGSVESGFSGHWSSNTETKRAHETSDDIRSRTLPLTLSLESSLDDTCASSHLANTPSRDEAQRSVNDIWEARSNVSHRSDCAGTAILFDLPVDPDVPSAESMMALVRKLEAFSSSRKSGPQPDEEPAFSDISTPTHRSPLPSRPASSTVRKPGLSKKDSIRSPGAFSAPMRSLKDPRRRNSVESPVSTDAFTSSNRPTRGGARLPPSHPARLPSK